MAIFVGILLAKKGRVPKSGLFHLVISVLFRMWKTTGNYSSSIPACIYCVSSRTKAPYLVVLFSIFYPFQYFFGLFVDILLAKKHLTNHSFSS